MSDRTMGTVIIYDAPGKLKEIAAYPPIEEGAYRLGDWSFEYHSSW